MKRMVARRRILAWTGLVASLSLLVGLGLRFERSRRLRDSVRDVVAAGRYSEARPLIDRWLEVEPRSAEAYYSKARVALGLDNLDDLAEGLARAESLGHPEPELTVLRAIVAARQGRHAEAAPILRRAFEEARRPDPLVDEALAKAYLETYDLVSAERVIARWSIDAPGDPKPCLWRVEVDRRKGEAEAVIGDYREALARDPGRLEARLALANELLAAHRCDEAATEYDAYIAGSPDDPAGHFGRGRAALELGDEDAAMARFERVLHLDPRHALAHRECGEAELRHGRFGRALAHLDRAVEAAPEDIEVRNSRALVLSSLGQHDRARAERAEVQRLRDEQREVERFRQRLLHGPRDLALECQAARWMFQHGHAREGVRWAEQALREHPGSPEPSRLLADHYERNGQTGLANFYRLQSVPEAAEGHASP